MPFATQRYESILILPRRCPLAFLIRRKASDSGSLYWVATYLYRSQLLQGILNLFHIRS